MAKTYGVNKSDAVLGTLNQALSNLSVATGQEYAVTDMFEGRFKDSDNQAWVLVIHTGQYMTYVVPTGRVYFWDKATCHKYLKPVVDSNDEQVKANASVGLALVRIKTTTRAPRAEKPVRQYAW